MKSKFCSFLIITLLSATLIFAQQSYPKREFRSAWIATVTNIDWPSSKTDPAAQKEQLIDILDNLKKAGMNAVMFQIRPECDALYKSNIEPWSYYVTGEQGKAPYPFYDPLEFAIQEAHKRGIELHAWFNPYRAERSAGSYPLSSEHVSKKHPDWILALDKYRLLDPGKQAVRDYVVSVIMDVVRRYDIDGVHFDDYFYESSITTQDDKTFASEPRGFTDKGDWRRDNVNRLVKQINDSVSSVKPYIKWGISPRGIYRNGIPAGTTGSDNYSAIFTDPVTWLNTKSIDYINPQLYWIFGGKQDYGKLLPWWAQTAENAGRHMYSGHADYRIKESTWSSSEVPNQVRLNRNTSGCKGSVFYNTTELLNNPKGFLDSLKNDLYLYPALVPGMAWKDQIPPNPVKNLRFERLPSTGVYSLVWDAPNAASDGEIGNKFVVYSFNKSSVSQTDLDDAKNIKALTGELNYVPQKTANTGSFYLVTSLDRNNNESQMSSIVELKQPLSPKTVLPAIYALDQKDTVILKWNYAQFASGYTLQVSTDSTFNSSLVVNKTNMTDTSFVLTNIAGQQKYFWRVQASNTTGISEFSPVSSFTTGFPLATSLAIPTKGTVDLPVTPVLSWLKQYKATSYRLQVGTSSTLSTGVVLDTTVADTTFKVATALQYNKIYYWRTKALNSLGQSSWSELWGFRTTTGSAVDDSKEMVKAYSLEQNYPNPFNPSTRISYSLAENGHVKLSIYNILGKEVAVLVDRVQSAGTHSVLFNLDKNGEALTSGIYFYTIKSGSFVSTKKMMIIK